MIGKIVKKWQPFFEIQDGGELHFECFQIYICDIVDMFQTEVPMFPQILVKIGQILKKWQQFFKIQVGGCRHVEKNTSGWTKITINEFLVCNFQL